MRTSSGRLRAIPAIVAVALLVAMACVPSAANTGGGSGSGSGSAGCPGCVSVPPGYSKYIVVFDDAGDVAECTARLQSYCDRQGCQLIYRYSIIRGVAIVAPDNATAQIMDMGNIKYVEKAQPVHVMLNDSAPLIGANQAWASGYTGRGVRVAIVDTGVDASHPDLSGKVVAWADLVNGRSEPYDDYGHGTHVSGIIAGSGAASGGKYRGVAPDASLMVAKALDASGSGDSSTILAGMDWAANHSAQVISLSLGSYQHLQAFDDAVASAVDAGIVVVVAAGNGGPDAGTISCPGDCPGAITVGASDKNDSVASFSSRGPAEGRVKPDVVNVGVDVVAARASGTSMGSPVNQYYTSASGTSMATPMTAGVVALLLQADPSLTPSRVKSALDSTAKPLGGSVPNNNAGYGRVQAKAALDYVQGNVSPTPSPSPSPSPTGYNVSSTHRWAAYNGANRPIEQFTVTPGSTVAQSVYYVNNGNRPDSYSVSVSGIPPGWWRFTLYGTATVPPGQGRYGNVYITPATAGTYAFTVTATSNGDRSKSSAQSYTLYVGARPSPSPSPSPSPRPSPSPSPSPSPTPPAGNSIIKGLKYVDQNRDGRLEAGESRIPGVTIRLYGANGALLAQTVTDRNGYYVFRNLAAGTYVVQEVVPSGYVATTPTRVTINLRANTVYTQHFGDVRA